MHCSEREIHHFVFWGKMMRSSQLVHGPQEHKSRICYQSYVFSFRRDKPSTIMSVQNLMGENVFQYGNTTCQILIGGCLTHNNIGRRWSTCGSHQDEFSRCMMPPRGVAVATAPPASKVTARPSPWPLVMANGSDKNCWVFSASPGPVVIVSRYRGQINRSTVIRNAIVPSFNTAATV